MVRPTPLLLTATLALTPILTHAQPEEKVSTPHERRDLNLTLYQNAFGVIQDTRNVTLKANTLTQLDVQGVSSAMTVDSVLVDAEGVDVLERNYRYNLLDINSLLAQAIGQTIQIQMVEDGPIEPRVLKAHRGGFMIVTDPDRPHMTQALPISTYADRVIFNDVSSDLTESPTLSMLVKSRESGDTKIRLNYLTGGFDWDASYTAYLDAGSMDLSAWVNLRNNTELNLEDARIQLLAGKVSRHKPPVQLRREMMMKADMMVASNAPVQEDTVGDYALFSIEKPVDLKSKEYKQIRLLDAPNVQYSKRYTLPLSLNQNIERARATVTVMFDNDKASGLGMRLPEGVIRFYESDQSGINQFVGEAHLPNMDRFESFEARLGEAFHFSAHNKTLSYNADRGLLSGQLTIQNSKDAVQQIDLLLMPFYISKHLSKRQTYQMSFCEVSGGKTNLVDGFDLGDANLLDVKDEGEGACRVTLELKPEKEHVIKYDVRT